MQLGSKGTIYIAVGLTILGFFVIFLGWNGAAEKDFVAGQIPYVISGGFAGLAIVLAGISLSVVEARRRDSVKLEAKLDQLIDLMGGDVETKAVDADVLERVTNLRKSRAKRRREAS